MTKMFRSLGDKKVKAIKQNKIKLIIKSIPSFIKLSSMYKHPY